jgi:hypothetical protein
MCRTRHQTESQANKHSVRDQKVMCPSVQLISETAKLISFLLDLRYSQQWLRRIMCSGICHRAVWYKFTDVSYKHNAFTFRVSLLVGWSLLLFRPEDGGNRFLRHAGYTGSHSRSEYALYFVSFGVRWSALKFSSVDFILVHITLHIFGRINEVVGNSDHIESNGRMINEYWIRKNVAGSGRALIWSTIQTDVRRKCIKPVMIADLLVDIWTRDLPNTKEECYGGLWPVTCVCSCKPR